MSTKNSSPLITLFTDFGLADPFVGIMKGVILGICPAARIVDLGHGAERFDAAAAGFMLATATPYFPAGTIHVAVVDPGVGGPRRPLAARIDGQIFVAPDNGLLSAILSAAGHAEAREIANPRLMRRPVSATFHGRDVFAPAAAHLARGFPFGQVGPRVAKPVRRPLPSPTRDPGRGLRGQVMWVDRFGNLITNISGADLETLGRFPGGELRVGLNGEQGAPVVSHYGAVAPGSVAAVVGSTGHLEVFANQGSAAHLLGAGPGMPLRVWRVLRPGGASTPSRSRSIA
jgi:hypothetical protein